MNRSDEQNKCLREFYGDHCLSNVEKLRKLEAYLQVYPVYDFCCISPMSAEEIDNLALRDMEDKFLIEKGLLKLQFAQF